MICMIALFNNMILKTLSNSIKQFKLNYNMNKLMMSLPELMKELYMVEGILKDSKGVHMAMKDSSGSSCIKKRKKFFKKSKQGKNKTRKGKSKGKCKCFIFGKKVHLKKDCTNFLKKK